MNEGKIIIPRKLNEGKIRVKRKYGKHPAKYISSLVDILNKKVLFRKLIPLKTIGGKRK